MILQTTELSPTQKTAIEQSVGRKLQDQENIVLCGGTPTIASETARQNATQEMRNRLALLDRSQRRVSIEDWMAAVLECSTAELPA